MKEIKTIICENHRQHRIEITYDFPYFLLSLDGAYKVKGNVITSKNAFSIGETYVGSDTEIRNLVITGIVHEDYITKRNELYNMFPIDSWGTLYYYEKDIERKIEYQVEDVEVDEKGVIRNFMISLICPKPYFTDIEEIKERLSHWMPLFEFPFESPIRSGD